MKTHKILLGLLIMILLIISGCSLLLGQANKGCTAGDACTYYRGTEGVSMYPEINPRMMYYRTQDLGTEDGNSVVMSMRLENRGASDSYGALFLSGFAPGITQMFIEGQNGDKLLVSANGVSNCFFNLNPGSGLAVNKKNFLGNIFGAFACKGLSGSANPAGWRIRADMGTILDAFKWTDAPAILKALNFDISGKNGIDNFNLGFDSDYFDVFVNGKKLAMLLYNLNFEQWGGDVFELRGDNQDSPGGDIDVKTFIIKMVGEWPAGQDYFDIPYQWKSCYGYTTFISPMVCIDPDPLSTENKVCTAETMNFGGSQGAPVAVTRMDQTNTGKGLILDFRIRNVGRGKVWDVGQLESCSPYYPGSVRSTVYDKVFIGPSLIGNDYLDCTPREIRLDPRTGEGRFTCRFDFSGNTGYDVGSAYTVPIKLELWYGYEQDIQDQLTVRRVS